MHWSQHTQNARNLSPGAMLLLLFIANLMNVGDRVTPAVIVEPLQEAFNLTDARIGLSATVFTLVCAVAAAPYERLADHFERTVVIGWGLVVGGMRPVGTVGLPVRCVASWQSPFVVAAIPGVLRGLVFSALPDLLSGSSRREKPQQSAGLRGAMVLVPIALFIGSVSAWMTSRTYVKDVQRVHASLMLSHGHF